jgi:hypothetical protein
MSLDPALEINGLRIVMGMSPDQPALAKARLGKAGWATRFLLRSLIRPGEVVYWSKNPSFSFFDGQVPACAHLKSPPSFSAHPYSPSDLINGTSAFLFFNQMTLRRAITQIMASQFWANTFVDNFRKEAASTFGEPHCSDLSQIPLLGRPPKISRSLHRDCTWETDNTFLLSQIAPSGAAAFVQWAVDTTPQ